MAAERTLMGLLRRVEIRRWVALLLLFTLTVGLLGPTLAAVSQGNNSTGQANAAASFSWSHTVSAGSNKLLVVRVALVNSARSITGVTFGGTALTLLANRVNAAGASGTTAALYYLVAPAVTTANVIVTLDGAADAVGYSTDFSGVSQSTPFGTAATASGAGSSQSVTVSAASSDLVIDVVATTGGVGLSRTPGSGQTGVTAATGLTSTDAVVMVSNEAGANSTTMSWTTGASSNWSSVGVSLKPSGPAIRGTVFEDKNYGGGAGRDLATANANGGGVVSGATVELYSSTGVYVTSTTTDSSGVYGFYGLASSTNYYVRVASTTVNTTRNCNNSCGGTVPVMTYRTTATSGTAVAVTDWVGGTNPAAADPGTAGAGATFNTTSYVYSVGQSGTAHAVAPITTGTATTSGVDFGFSFDVVSNNNNSGQGSLRQFLANANEIIAAGLAISGGVANLDNAIFMISNGTAAAGLRSTNNYFSGGVTTITLTSAFPAVIGCVIDARKQPGWSGTPLVVLSGSGLTGSSDGFQINGQGTIGGVTVAGFVIRNFPRYGINAWGNGNTIKGNWIGLSSAGTAAAANGGDGIYIGAGSSGDVIGGTGAYEGNVTSGNSGSGIHVLGSNTVIQGNIAGLNAAGSAAVPNGGDGITLESATGVTVGGSSSAARNIISGNNPATSTGIWISYGSGHTIKGNWIGLDATGNNTIANNYAGIDIAGSSNNTVGGTAAGEANVIAGNSGIGIVVRLQNNGSTNVAASGNRISGNSIYGNSGLGIDLNDDGVTANNGSKSATIGNQGMDFPVFTSAALSGTTLTVAGYVGSAAGQTTFANAVVEVFIADVAAAGNGEGKTYLGTLTANASGNFSGTITGVTGISGTTARITATARDGSNNTSEFGTNMLVTRTMAISGTVFEDLNYGGGAGRGQSGAGGSGVTGARVELYNSSGTYVSATTTAAGGGYSFGSLTAGVYFVRVVNSTVLSTRTGASASLVPVMTYRTEAGAGTPADVSDEVGGMNPVKVDAASGAGGTALWTSCAAENATCTFTGTRTVRYGGSASNGSGSSWVTRVLTGGTPCTNTVFGDPISGTPKSCYLLNSDYQSVSTVNANGGDVAGVDFGFNFDTVVNLNDSGQGSLRQAITNANTLTGDSSLAVAAGRTAGIEHIVFMISNGTTGSGGILSLSGGLRSNFNYFSAGVATIAPATALPALSTSMVLDGQTQPGWTSNPIIELNGTSTSAGTDGLMLTGTPIRLRGLVLNRFKRHGVYVSGASATVQGCWIGLNNAGTLASANSGSGIYTAGSGHTIGSTTSYHRNIISGNTQYGVAMSADAGATGNSTVTNNYIGTNAAGTVAVANGLNGIYVLTTGNTIGGSVSGAGNVISGNGMNGLQMDTGPNTVQGNLIGTNAAGIAALGNASHGIYVGGGSGHSIGGASGLQRNVISGNSGGVFVNAGGSNTIQGNYIGTTADGASALANTGYFGVELYGSGGNTVGGTAAGAGNLISGQSGAGKGGIYIASNSNTVQGNAIGTNAAASASVANAGPGIAIAMGSITGNTIGGTATGAGNTIAYNTQQGIAITGTSSTGNSIRRNAIYGNTGIGIDIAGGGRTANNGTKSATLGNQEMDTPVFTAAVVGGTTLTVSGYVGSAASQSAFGSATVEIFKAVSDGSGYGQGQVYLGTVTADTSGNFTAQSLTVSGLSLGDVITATATDGSGNTSEFSPNFTTTGLSIAGSVYEDLNYGGGAGRNKAASPGSSGRPVARVELYTVSGTTATYSTATTTDGLGAYSFTGLSPGNYAVRVVTSTVSSSRSGYISGLLPVLTFRTDASSGAAVDVTDNVGGNDPAAASAGSAAAGAVFNTGSGVFSAGATGSAKSFSLATLVGSAVAGVDFGFNFSTVVNVNDSGTGSLRQAITNANTLGGDASLAQSGLTAGIENLVFMISNGTAAAGLRSANNYFSGGVATISPTSVLPDISAPLVLDAQTQPGWSANPIVELNGTSGGSNYGLTLAGGGSTVRGFVINRWAASGLRLSSSGNTVQGCWVGLNAAGTAASGNSWAGIHITTGSNQIGGTTATTRNVISGNGGGAGTLNAGLLIGSGAGSNTIQGNTIGLNAAGTAAVANLPYGVDISSTGNTLGGTAAGAGNVMSGNTLDGAIFRPGADSNTIQGNLFGANAANSAVVANGRLGLDLQGNNNTVGGTASNAANVVRGNSLGGIAVVGSSATGNNLSANSIYGNGGVGIDLAYNGLTTNDGAKTASQPNLLMDYPVITAGSVSGTTLTVSGYVGSAASQSTFAGARVEVFISDGTNTNGQGQTYAGFLTADASGNFSGSITGVSGASTGSTRITATATDGSGNTSEFGPNFTLGGLIAGTVFEDLNYGGGAGRNKATALAAGASVRPGARVELVQISGTTGTVVAVATTDASGNYSFPGLTSASYALRVLSSSVTSSRSGYVASLMAVSTYHANSSGGAAVDVTDEVGGRAPAFTTYASTPANVGTSSPTTVDYSDAIAQVTVTGGSVTGIDFGFSFNVVSNNNDSGQGSLRQAMTNANTLGGDASLAQSGRSAGIENIVFMISNGTAGNGLRSVNNFFSGGVATVTLASGLPQMTTAMVVNAQTQPGWLAAPLVQINCNSAAPRGFTVTGGGSTMAGFVINRCTGGGIYLGFAGNNTVAGNYIGTNAAGTAASANGGVGVYIEDSPNNTLGGTAAGSGNVISGNSTQGVVITGSSTGNTVRGNTIGLNAAGTARLNNGSQGLYVNSTGAVIGGTSAAARNVISGNYYENIKLDAGSSGATVQGNYIGVNASGVAGPVNGSNNILITSSNNTVGGSAAGAGNVIGNAVGRGVVITGAVSGNIVQGNSIFANSVQGIDLANDGVTANDGAKTAGQPNLLMDFPVLTAANIAGGTLTVAGYVGSAAGQSTFAGARVEVFISDASNANGQGQTYLGFVTADASGNFSGSITGVTGVTSGSTRITAAATDTSSNTSEFGPNLLVGMTLSGKVFEDVNYGGGAGRNLASSGGIGLAGAVVELYAGSGAYVSSTTTAAGGSYSFVGVGNGNYFVRVASTTVASQRSGTTAALRSVMTYRSSATTGTAVDVTDWVGGTNPALADPGAATTGALLNTSSYVFSAGLSGTAHAVAPVTTNNASVASLDFGFNFDTVVNTNDSGQGSLRQAITNANTLGGDVSLAQSGRTAAIENLVFMISNGTAGGGLRSSLNYFSSGYATIAPTSQLPTLSTTMVMNAQTQPGWTATPVVRIDGTGAGASSAGLALGCSGCSVRGFAINNAYGGIYVANATNATIAGNHIGIDPSGTSAQANRDSGIYVTVSSGTVVGGASSADRNVIAGNTKSGIFLDSSAAGTVITGNYIGTNAAGSAAVANNASASTSHAGITLSSATGTQIGGTSSTLRNVISGNGRNGIWAGSGSVAVVAGNYIGLNAAGTAALANSNDGISLNQVGSFTVGGSAAGAGNVISGNGASGLYAYDTASSPLVVQGNLIGTNAAGSAAVGNNWGLYIEAFGVQVGGVNAGEGNVISGNTGIGVLVHGYWTPVNGVRVLRNSIHGNGGLGIDLKNDGVTVNDGVKTSGTANLSMDSPVFTSARATGAQLTVAGYIGTAAGQSVFGNSRVEIFLSDNDGTGYGEGKTWLGTLTADASGNFSGTLTMPVSSLLLGSKLTATATDTSNNTSEFGANFAGLIVDLVVNSNLDEADTSIGDGRCNTASGVCTLRAAIAEVNAWTTLSGTPSIVFAIPGCSSYGSAGCRITPATALPSVTRSVLIDGSTQTGFSTSTYVPIVEISGTAAPAATTGIVVAANNSTVRGLAINRFSANGITLSGSGGSLLGLRLGLNVSTATAAANGGAGAYITGSGAIIGGSAAADRNVIGGNTGNGITVAASGANISTNYIGTDSAGSTGLGNGGAGVFTTASSLSGIGVSANTIVNNGSNGVTVAGGAAQVQILGNSFAGNGGLGIDLGNDGVTVNTGSTDSTRPNNGINQPVITGAGIGGSSMTVYGYVGTGAGQAVFANARVEFFKAAADPTGYGEGQTYLGYLTTDASGRFTGTVAFPGGAIAVGDPVTATVTDAAGNTSEFGPNWTTTSVAALTPGSFNAFDTDAASNTLSWVIRSRIAGAATNIAVIALDNNGTALHPGFTGNVTLTWVDARNDTGAVSGSCRSSWVDAGSAGTAAFSNNNRVTVSVIPPASATRVMRLKMTYTSAGGALVTACSNDALAVLPASYSWLGASDTDSATAGTARTLSNTSASGGNVHRAGRPFTVRAQALDANGALMTGYDGTPVLATTACLLPSGCTAGTLTAANTAAVAGVYTHNAVSYAEVGAIQVAITDSSYADVDASDTAVGVRTLTSSTLSVGRFVPDSLTVVISTAGQFATANGSCLASGSGATFIGQGFTWATAPQLTLTARNAAGATTAFWAGSLMKLSAAMVSEALAASGTGSATLSSSFGAVSVTDLGSGQARVTASATDRFLLDLASGSVQDSVTPTWTWSATVADSSEAGVAGNPTLSSSASQGSVTFNSGGVFHSGRLTLSPGYGDTRAGVRLLAQLQRYTAAGWVTMTEDQGCITINNNNVGVESPVGVFTTAGVCAAPMQAAVTTRGGRAWISLPATPGGAPGRLTLRLAGGGATGNSCTPAGASAALVGMGLPWLMGGSAAAGPQAFATWGATQRDAVLRRETW